MFRKILMDDLDRRDFIQGSERCPPQPTEGREDRAASGSPAWQGKASSSRHLMTREENEHKRSLLALVHVLQHIKTSELQAEKDLLQGQETSGSCPKKKKNKLPEGFQQITWWWEVGGSRVGDQLVHGFSYLLMVR